MLAVLFLVTGFPQCRSRKTTRLEIKKPVGEPLCDPLDAFNWTKVGRAWLKSQSHGGKLESGEPVCLPLLSKRALFVTHYHRLSHRRAPWPQNLLACISPSWPWWRAVPSHTLSSLQKENMSSRSAQTRLKRSHSPRRSSSLLLPIDLLNLRLQSSTCLSVFLS